ncbi:MAG: hypothetical protein HUU20_03080 [Pirellulales bacterium]|nr:hypothetical protein [Pirellulales bacterium]
MTNARTAPNPFLGKTVVCLLLLPSALPIALGVPPAATAVAAGEKPVCRIHVDPGHPWQPPFGLDRVGRPLAVTVEVVADASSPREYVLVGYRQGKELARTQLALVGASPCQCHASFDTWPAELALLATTPQGAIVELARQSVEVPQLEAEAIARPDRIVNPIDLGTVFVPYDWLLLGGDQNGTVDVAAVNRSDEIADVVVSAWFESAPAAKTTAGVRMVRDCRAQHRLPLPAAPAKVDRDLLHISIASAAGKELWHKTIPTMLVRNPPAWPEFGAVETKLRYDAPISVRGSDGTYSALSYADAWESNLQDVVVALPNGTRFVFWRGSSYIPFWAGRYNTGFCYEWAEKNPPADACDAVEPLMDKELRYSRVRIVESTPARVHVRWSYQSCDLQYRVWGDSAVEDFYFYPDGFGIRTLTLQCHPEDNYELSELIVLTPQSAYPLSVLPPNLVDILFLDGQKHELAFPYLGAVDTGRNRTLAVKSRDMPAVYRIRLHKNDPATAVYFSPFDRKLPEMVYRPFFDNGQLVTPVYWGSHWPLARGNTTGGAINDRLSLTPGHNSILTWGYFHQPATLRTTAAAMLDTLGRSRVMAVRTWVWLIGLTDADDASILQVARSFSAPPSMEVRGARLDTESHAFERRAIRMTVDSPVVNLRISPATVCVDPVFELSGVPGDLAGIELAGRRLGAREYSWDGKTLWIRATLTGDTPLKWDFNSRSPK